MEDPGGALGARPRAATSRCTGESARAGDAYRDAIAAIQRGEIVVFYPEATYTADPDGWPMKAKNGVGRIALVTGAPVIPVANWGTQHVVPPGRGCPGCSRAGG